MCIDDKARPPLCRPQVLFGSGYAWLDVRSELECDEVGKVKGSVNVPFVNLKRVYDAKEGKKVVQKASNPNFLAMVSPPRPWRCCACRVG